MQRVGQLVDSVGLSIYLNSSKIGLDWGVEQLKINLIKPGLLLNYPILVAVVPSPNIIMQHISYQKIRERSKKWQLDIQQHQLLEKIQWVVTEKIHGANFSILVDKDQVQFAKRKEILENDEDFFGHSLLKEVLIQKAKELFLLFNSKSQNIEQLNIYGELFGGTYPHPNISINTQVEAVQTGIHYSPNIELAHIGC